jgi:hypothetical protein
MNEITTKTQTALSLLQNYNVDEDYVQVRTRDIITPKLRLSQALSPECNGQDSWARPGQFVLPDEKKIVYEGGKNAAPVFITPVFFWLNWVEFNTKRDVPKDQIVLDRSFDPQSALAKSAERFDQVTNDKGKKVARVTEFYNFIVAINGDINQVASLSFYRSAHKVGKLWLNRIYKQRINDARAPMFIRAFGLGSIYVDEGPDAKYYAPSIGDTMDTPEDDYRGLIDLALFFRENRVKVMEKNTEAHSDEPVVNKAVKSDEPPF